MMIDPPIEELREKAGNEYILANVIAKRAKTLMRVKAINRHIFVCVLENNY